MRHLTTPLLLLIAACGSRFRDLPAFVEVDGLGDSFQSEVVVSTYRFAVPAELLLGEHDSWLQGLLHKDSRELGVELRVLTRSPSPRAWSSARLGGPDGPERPAEITDARADCTDVGCVHWEQVAVTLTLDDALEAAREGGRVHVGGEGATAEVVLVPAEVAALLAGLDAAAGPGNPLRRRP